MIDADSADITNTAAIEVRHLTKRYGKTRGVENINFPVRRGEIFGFIGPNGAGRSTTIRTLLGLIRRTSGTASILGLDIERDHVEIMRHVGYLPSEVFYYDGMCASYAASFCPDKDCSTRIEELPERLDLDLNRKIEDMSLGDRKKVGIIQGLMLSPDVLILDEPTSGLDPLMRRTFFDLIRQAALRPGGQHHEVLWCGGRRRRNNPAVDRCLPADCSGSSWHRNLNMATFAGFYGVLMFYIGIMIAAYAMHLGLNAVSRESVDGTYEFLFVRPRSRYSILASKLLAALICLLLFCTVNAISSVGGYLTLDRPAEGETASASDLTTNEPAVSTVCRLDDGLLMVGLVFLAMGAVLASLCRHPETASRIGNCSVLLCYLAGAVYDIFSDHACSWIARVLSPMRYWLPDQILDRVFSVPYGILALGIVVFALTSSLAVFGKRDLTA